MRCSSSGRGRPLSVGAALLNDNKLLRMRTRGAQIQLCALEASMPSTTIKPPVVYGLNKPACVVRTVVVTVA